MNTSHTVEEQTNFDNETPYILEFLTSKAKKIDVQKQDASTEKLLKLVDNVTPNYVLGYN